MTDPDAERKSFFIDSLVDWFGAISDPGHRRKLRIVIRLLDLLPIPSRILTRMTMIRTLSDNQAEVLFFDGHCCPDCGATCSPVDGCSGRSASDFWECSDDLDCGKTFTAKQLVENALQRAGILLRVVEPPEETSAACETDSKALVQCPSCHAAIRTKASDRGAIREICCPDCGVDVVVEAADAVELSVDLKPAG